MTAISISWLSIPVHLFGSQRPRELQLCRVGFQHREHLGQQGRRSEGLEEDWDVGIPVDAAIPPDLQVES